MRKFIVAAVTVMPIFSFSQVGLKAGLNFANVSNTSSINSSNRSGFMVGAFFSPSSKSFLGSKTEVIFSRQGYDYRTSSNEGAVNLDYITLQQGMYFNITKYFSLLLGMQTSYLMNAKVDSSNSNITGTPYDKVMDYYNRFDYGYGFGFEVHPYKGLLVGAKYNVSLGQLYKSDPQSGQMPSFSSENLKNNVVQIFTGWRFGK